MKKVFICSPLKGDMENNLKNARKYCRDALASHYLPIAPHVYFTQFLDDTKESEREIGIKCGLELLPMCDEIWVYGTPSEGMKTEIELWKALKNTPIKRKK